MKYRLNEDNTQLLCASEVCSESSCPHYEKDCNYLDKRFVELLPVPEQFRLYYENADREEIPLEV